MSAAELSHLLGTRLPEGTFTISAADDRRLAPLVGAEPTRDGTANPLWAFVATQRGIGLELEELLAMADFDVADGPMVGECRIEFAGPLLVDRTYRVSGEIEHVERKTGRRTGTFDLMRVRYGLTDTAGTETVAYTNVFVLRRRDA